MQRSLWQTFHIMEYEEGRRVNTDFLSNASVYSLLSKILKWKIAKTSTHLGGKKSQCSRWQGDVSSMDIHCLPQYAIIIFSVFLTLLKVKHSVSFIPRTILCHVVSIQLMISIKRLESGEEKSSQTGGSLSMESKGFCNLASS